MLLIAVVPACGPKLFLFCVGFAWFLAMALGRRALEQKRLLFGSGMCLLLSSRMVDLLDVEAY